MYISASMLSVLNAACFSPVPRVPAQTSIVSLPGIGASVSPDLSFVSAKRVGIE